MSIFAYVHNSSGEITQITGVNRGFSNFYDGMVINDYTLFDVTDREDVRNNRHLFYCKNGELKQRVSPPTDLYKWNNETEEWEFNSEFYFSRLRYLRDEKLSGSDWTQLPDAPLTDAQKAEWQTYRQALRDVPINNSNVTSLEEVVWPTQPAS